MKTVITAEFTGYPGAPDDQAERRFRVGDEPTDLSDAYVDLLIGKGLAERVADAPAEPEAPAAEPAAESPAVETAEAEIPAPRSRRTAR